MLHDTTPEAARVRWNALARLTGEQRLRQALELSDFIFRVRADGERASRQRRARAAHPTRQLSDEASA